MLLLMPLLMPLFMPLLMPLLITRSSIGTYAEMRSHLGTTGGASGFMGKNYQK
jgi:hypothetical protein